MGFPVAPKAPNEQSGAKNDQLALKKRSLRGDQASEEAPPRLETDQFARKEGKFTRGWSSSGSLQHSKDLLPNWLQAIKWFRRVRVSDEAAAAPGR